MLEISTKRVEEIVNNSKKQIEILVKNGKEKIDSGTSVAKECEGVLQEIVISSESVTGMVKEIALASKEQAQGIMEITKAITQVDQVTQLNSSSSTDSAKAASNLFSQALILNSLMQDLIKIIEGEGDNKIL